MSDAHFDGLRDCGEYPPKGWGWMDLPEQKRRARNSYRAGNRDAWLVEFIEFYGSEDQ